MRSNALWSCALLLSVAPAVDAQSRPKRYTAATDATVLTMIEEGYGSTPVQVIWIQNHSTVPIVVYSVSLRDCENVRQSCSPTRMNLAVSPGARTQLKRVEPRNPEASFSFRYSFGWRADSSDAEVLRLMAENGSSLAKEQLQAREEAIVERRAAIGGQDLVLDSASIATLGAQIARIRGEPDSLVLRVGETFLMRRVRVMAVDAHGGLLGRLSAFQWRVGMGAVSVVKDTLVGLVVGRTSVELQAVLPAGPMTTEIPIVVVADSVRRPEGER